MSQDPPATVVHSPAIYYLAQRFAVFQGRPVSADDLLKMWIGNFSSAYPNIFPVVCSKGFRWREPWQ